MLVQEMKFIEVGYWFVDLLDTGMNVHFLIIIDRNGDFNNVGVRRTDYIHTTALLQQEKKSASPKTTTTLNNFKHTDPLYLINYSYY